MFRTKFSCVLLAALVAACGSNDRGDKKTDADAQSESNVERSEATLPAKEVRGAESLSLTLYPAGNDGTPIALGQIFSAPKGHPILIKTEFLYRNSGLYSSTVNLKLRLSPWLSDRPGATPIWESDVVSAEPAASGWISFDLPHVRLDPKQKYIAWLSMIGIPNAERSAFGIVAMGPWRKGGEPIVWNYDYSEGLRATWKIDGVARDIEHMTAAPWMTERRGYNLHFKMVFENRSP